MKKYYDQSVEPVLDAFTRYMGRAEKWHDKRVALFSVMDWCSEDGEPSDFIYPLKEDVLLDDGDVVWRYENNEFHFTRI